MVGYCIVENCRKQQKLKGEKVTHFPFPADRVLRSKWLKQLKLNRVSISCRICSKHFASDCFEVSPEIFKSIGWKERVRLRLLKGSIPTRFLTPEEIEDDALSLRTRQQHKTTTSNFGVKSVYDFNAQPTDFVNEKGDTEEDDVPCLQRELRLEMDNSDNYEHSLVRIVVDKEDEEPLGSELKIETIESVSLTQFVDFDYNSETIETETINPKIEIGEDLENLTPLEPELRLERVADTTYREIKIEDFPSGFSPSHGTYSSDDNSEKENIASVDASIQSISTLDAAGDGRIKKIVITFARDKPEKIQSDATTQTS